MNPGFDPEEIAQLKDECAAEQMNFVYVEDEFEDEEENDEHAHVQFVGKHEGKEVIYDALIYTLRLHHSTLVYDEALERTKKEFPNYVSLDERGPGHKANPKEDDEAEMLLTELIEEIEEAEDIKVREHVEVETNFDFGIGLEVGLNVEEITEDVIEEFIKAFNADRLKLDNTLYSFSGSNYED